jgi:hypothetical protein
LLSCRRKNVGSGYGKFTSDATSQNFWPERGPDLQHIFLFANKAAVEQMEEIEYEDRAAKEATDMLLQKEFPQVHCHLSWNGTLVRKHQKRIKFLIRIGS